MEGVLERKNPAASRAAGDLDSRLVGLGAGVREKHAGAGRGACEMQQLLGELDLRRGGEEVRDVAERGELLADGSGHGGVRVAQGVHRDAGQQVQVLRPVGVPDVRALSAHKDALRGAEDGQQGVAIAGGEALLGGGGAHRAFLLRHSRPF